MNRSFLLPPLTADEMLELQRLLRSRKTGAGLYRRCLLIWQSAAGYNISEASRIATLHYTNAHRWVKRFMANSLPGLQDRKRPGRPRIHGSDIETLIIQTSTSQPRELGLGFTTWSSAKNLRSILPSRHRPKESAEKRYGRSFPATVYAA